jgi:hypothetical protein
MNQGPFGYFDEQKEFKNLTQLYRLTESSEIYV